MRIFIIVVSKNYYKIQIEGKFIKIKERMLILNIYICIIKNEQIEFEKVIFILNYIRKNYYKISITLYKQNLDYILNFL